MYWMNANKKIFYIWERNEKKKIRKYYKRISKLCEIKYLQKERKHDEEKGWTAVLMKRKTEKGFRVIDLGFLLKYLIFLFTIFTIF